MTTYAPTYAIGDVHGQLGKLRGLLEGAGLLDAQGHWSGAHSRLWFMGDLFDRGPHGIGVCDLVMRLEAEAALEGGFVGTLLGNHEPLVLSTARFGRQKTAQGMSFRASWLHNGGRLSDLSALTPEHIAWLERRPALALEGETLLMHADSLFYLDYGDTLEAVNEAVGAVMGSEDPPAWDELLGQFARRMEFWDPSVGERNLERVLHSYGAARVLHGHTPISYLLGTDPDEVRGPLHYREGRCTNVDGGMMYKSGHGFVYALPEL